MERLPDRGSARLRASGVKKVPRTLPADRLSGPGRIAREKLAPVMTEARKGGAILHDPILLDQDRSVKRTRHAPYFGQLPPPISAIVSQ
ncbi:hypothetical protein SBA_ch1_14540 [Sphingomonas bisphenolicum]|uniref:Uncharacterized protein n=1 Tax=Sphingomonas bisphenolicum TaxID=296544 RepID=A0ABM7FVT9_9SPHN|nr:hypothetical protein SBA_ch1_14540 [Sphingomonas bisphenolicum]